MDTILDIKRWTLLRWEIRNFCQNDQSNALQSLDKVKPGTLLIRDLGYFTLQTIAELNQRAIHYLYRLKNGINIYCPDTQKKITLSKVLVKKRRRSMLVLLGEAKIPVRLVAIPLDPQTTEYRRRKALKNRDKRLNPNKENIKRLGWAIFITSVPEEVWTDKQVEQAYKVRWNIELLFKAWKSNTPIVEAMRDSSTESRTRMLLIGMLLYTFLVLIPLIHRCWQAFAYDSINSISWTKIFILAKWIGPEALNTAMLHMIIYYAQYEKRKRKNLVEALLGGP